MKSIVLDVKNSPDERDVVHRAVQALAEGKVVAFPTETVYGVAVSALNADAVETLVQAKKRGQNHAFALAVKSAEEALDYIPPNRLSQRLARRCWPGPITLVVDDVNHGSLIRQLPESVQKRVSPEGTVGLRVPGHRLILEALRLMPGPMVLTSANESGQPDAVTATDVVNALGHAVNLVIDDGKCQYGQSSTVLKVNGNNISVLREGVVTKATINRLSAFMVLLVCTGNTCRSPMAETLCKHRLAEKLGCTWDELNDRGVLVMSAGINAGSGGRPTPEAVQVMADRGLDLSGHVTQPLTDRLVRYADSILTMTNGHRQAILSHWPEAAERTQVLCKDHTDVADPIGGPRELYRRCADQIDSALQQRIAEFEL